MHIMIDIRHCGALGRDVGLLACCVAMAFVAFVALSHASCDLLQ